MSGTSTLKSVKKVYDIGCKLDTEYSLIFPILPVQRTYVCYTPAPANQRTISRINGTHDSLNIMDRFRFIHDWHSQGKYTGFPVS